MAFIFTKAFPTLFIVSSILILVNIYFSKILQKCVTSHKQSKTTFFPSLKEKLKKQSYHILVIIGTRPEVIKMAPIIYQLQKFPHVTPIVCVTGQHKEMIEPLLDLFQIQVDCNLNLIEYQSTSQAMFMSHGLLQMEQVLKEMGKIDLIMVQGDTSSAMLAGLNAYYMKIPIAHIEAGLRTGDLYSPFPEEMNRKFLSIVADLHFAPTEVAKEALLKENIPKDKIFVVGNPVIDSLFWTLKKSVSPQTKQYLEKWDLENQNQAVILVTAHRRENFGETLKNICNALIEIAEKGVKIIMPVHMNPTVKQTVHKLLSGVPNIILTEPLSYETFVHVMNKVDLILTDSGGIQEEATALGKPTLVMREKTERTGLLDY